MGDGIIIKKGLPVETGRRIKLIAFIICEVLICRIVCYNGNNQKKLFFS